MSAFLLGTGFRADMGTCIRKLVLLKLIDACEDDGSRIFPAVATVARAAQCSSRQVQREIRAFVDIGLLKIVREGGKGRRSTNEYALVLDVLAAISKDGWDAYAERVAAGAKGDTVSPLDEAPKGDRGDTDRVTAETPKGDNACHTTPPDPSLDPSIERDARESEREDSQPEDPKAVEKSFWRLVKDWPGFAGMPKEPAKAAWFALSAEDRAEAERKLPEWLKLLKAQRKSHTPAPSTYFRERLWADVPEPEEEKPAALEAKPFGPLWQVARMKRLLHGPSRTPGPMTAFQSRMVETGQASEADIRREQQAKSGWPEINTMHQWALDRKGVHVAPELERLCQTMEAVPVGSDTYEAWRMEHERRGWPWVPDPGAMRVVYFPRGGPAGLAEFEEAVKQAGKADKRG
ncbi:helix-turn-helix domain-containing protein [Chelativorans sp. YIM 93263]|uniref:helix-turn-helix domain-containing protein n=1 Tax=Chelativorans sp. YIM 93263 TaxID=2906648 RepID=UPI002378C54C|nr:helix-turn-helix domain-containing protein [Chelativorans sp. YIM 93263]